MLRGFSSSLILFLLLVEILCPASSFGRALPNNEEEMVVQAVKNFLDAEVRQDYRAVYDSFAPSSLYARTHTYEEYKKEALTVEDRVSSYDIVRVTYIMDNEDYTSWSQIEKFSQVEVEVTFLNIPTKRHYTLNIGFIFFKERGKWFKS